MLTTNAMELADRAVVLAMHAAEAYLRTNTTLPPDMVHYGAAAREVIDAARKAIPDALADAKEAIALGMADVAVHTFAASLRLAGIAAAKAIAEKGEELAKQIETEYYQRNSE